MIIFLDFFAKRGALAFSKISLADKSGTSILRLGGGGSEFRERKLINFGFPQHIGSLTEHICVHIVSLSLEVNRESVEVSRSLDLKRILHLVGVAFRYQAQICL